MLFDLDALPAASRYKLLTSTVVPRPIAWVVTQDAAGRLNAAPYSFFNVFGSDPPIIALGVGNRPSGAVKDTMANIAATGEFTICLVTEATLAAMNITAADFEAGVDEVAQAGLATLPSTKVAPPRLADSPVALECTLFQTIPIGAHSLVLGQVRAMHVRDAAVMDPLKCYIDSPALGLVGRMHGAGWYTRLDDRLEVKRVTAAQLAEPKAQLAEPKG
ncbi:flavin reductase family protein [Falsiroseomonas sp.]|uniref:flavin reductase family protein n=1 Tax=Falsiroseomonas sp. TaxID=2870721 RepID=UPI0027342A9F|nr:flavin reductase family protein [Falsiroseomonas sp.]MDP3417345.1 flavin reductase family protein [Falsiroseomonas sp.]